MPSTLPMRAIPSTDLKLESFLASPSPTPANIESLIHDPTFLLTSNPAFVSIGREERQMQSTWADRLPEARRMAGELEREKQKERKKEEEKGDKNVERLVRG